MFTSRLLFKIIKNKPSNEKRKTSQTLASDEII